MGFATPAELSAYTKGLIAADDPRSSLILEGATKAIQRIAGWHISPSQSETIRLDGSGLGDMLQLPSLYVTDVTSITLGGRSVLSPTVVTDFDWSVNGNISRPGYHWPEGLGNISVTFTHGYPDEEIADLKQIILQVSSHALSSPTGATREQAGQVSMQWATTAPGVAGGLSLLARDLAVVASYTIPKRN